MVRFLVLSLVIHAAFFSTLDLWSRDDFHKKTELVEIVYNPSPSLPPKDKQLPNIQHLEIPEKLITESNEEALFSSKVRRRVLLETRAKDSGFTQNRQRGPRFLEPFPGEENSQGNQKMLSSQEGLPVLDVRKELGQLEQGLSTIHIPLPDNITVGSLTALNTDRNLYYTFYSRIEKQVYFRWAKLIEKAYESFPTNKQAQLHRSGILKTKLKILLNPKGEFVRAELQMGSGVQKFDVSPALAFHEARVFPNPPADLVQEDGYIHLDYIFSVDFRRVQ
ncbi:MAG: hypothetical protein ACK5W9_08850 [Bdellovibrionales bacterium]